MRENHSAVRETQLVCVQQQSNRQGAAQFHWYGRAQTFCFNLQCSVLKEKLDSLLKTLNDESQASSSLSNPPPTIAEETEDGDGSGSACDSSSDHSMGSSCTARPQIFRPREQLMLRANSLKKAIRQIIEHAEKGKRWVILPAVRCLLLGHVRCLSSREEQDS